MSTPTTPKLYALTPIDQTEGLEKVFQTKLHNPPVQNGNCFRAVISTITQIPIDDIPPIEENMNSDTWHIELFCWLKNRGWLWRGAPEFDLYYGKGRFFDFMKPEMLKDRLYMVVGKTNRFEGMIDHICIYKNGELWHDPHPNNTGLTTMEYFEIIEPIHTGYLRPLPAGTQVLQPGMVAVSLTTLQEVKKAFSDYVKSEGCSCCCDIDAHNEASIRIGELLGFEKYEDGSGYNFY